MTEAAQLYRGVHRLLGRAKAEGWKIIRTPAGQWRVKPPAAAFCHHCELRLRKLEALKDTPVLGSA